MLGRGTTRVVAFASVSCVFPALAAALSIPDPRERPADAEEAAHARTARAAAEAAAEAATAQAVAADLRAQLLQGRPPPVDATTLSRLPKLHDAHDLWPAFLRALIALRQVLPEGMAARTLS